MLERRLDHELDGEVPGRVPANGGESADRAVLQQIDSIAVPRQPSADQPVSVVDHQIGAPHLSAAQRRELRRQSVEVGLEALPSRRLPGPGRLVAPVLEQRAGTVHGQRDRVGRGGRRQGPAHLFAPTSRPETNCFWKAKNTIVVGTAAISAPAATTFHAVV